MLLDALMAATERLLITYTGNDERTNLPRSPAVPVGELIDTVERTVRCQDATAREQIEIHHPLQPFDPRNFTPGERGPWGFDPHALAGAQALTRPRTDPSAFLPEPLPPPADPVVELAALVRFVEHPTRALLRGRLGVTVGDWFDEVQDAMPVELDPLAGWGVGQRLLDGVLAGAELDACRRAETARGSLPPGILAQQPLDKISRVVEQLARVASELGAAGAPGAQDVSHALPDGRMLAGTVTGVCGDTIRAISYSRVRPRERLRAWVRLLALSAAAPERPWESLVIGRARPGADMADVTVARIPPLGDDAAARARAAHAHLAVLLDLYDRGMREPIPLACEASAAYAQAAAGGGNAEAAARTAWRSGFGYDKEDRQPEHLLVYGGEIDLSELLDQVPRDDEDWPPAHDGRFGRYAHRLWDGVLGLEAVSDR